MKYFLFFIIVSMMGMLLLVGQVGGNERPNKGGGSNYLCLPNDPDNGKPYSYANDVLYGAEYETVDLISCLDLVIIYIKKDVPCAVCRRKGKSYVRMIPGKRYFIYITTY